MRISFDTVVGIFGPCGPLVSIFFFISVFRGGKKNPLFAIRTRNFRIRRVVSVLCVYPIFLLRLRLLPLCIYMADDNDIFISVKYNSAPAQRGQFFFSFFFLI